MAMIGNRFTGFTPQEPELYGTQSIAPQTQQPIPQDPRIAQAMQPGFFGKGGKGWNFVGMLGDALQQFGGGQATFAPQQQRWREMEEERKSRLAELLAKRQRPQPVNLGNGGFGTWSEDGGLQIQREPTQQPGEQERLLERYLDPSTPENVKSVIRPMLRGAQYDAGVMAPIIQLKTDSAQEIKQTVPGKAPSAGAGGGGAPKGIFTVRSRDDYDRLPSGTKYTAPDGSVRIKQ